MKIQESIQEKQRKVIEDYKDKRQISRERAEVETKDIRNGIYLETRTERIKKMFECLKKVGAMKENEPIASSFNLDQLKTTGISRYKSDENIDRAQVIYANLNEARERGLLGVVTEEQFIDILKKSLIAHDNIGKLYDRY